MTNEDRKLKINGAKYGLLVEWGSLLHFIYTCVRYSHVNNTWSESYSVGFKTCVPDSSL